MFYKSLRGIRPEFEAKLKRFSPTGNALCGALIFAAASSQAAQSVTLAWDPSSGPNLAGYRVHEGTSSGIYTQVLYVGNVTTATISNLTAGVTFYFAVTAYNTSGLESTYSNEVSFAA